MHWLWTQIRSDTETMNHILMNTTQPKSAEIRCSQYRKSVKGQRNGTRNLYNVSGNNNSTPQWAEECHRIANMATKPHPHQTTLSLMLWGLGWGWDSKTFKLIRPDPELEISFKVWVWSNFDHVSMPMAWWTWLPRGQLMGREGGGSF